MLNWLNTQRRIEMELHKCPTCKGWFFGDPEKRVFCGRKCLDEHNDKQAVDKLIKRLKKGIV